MTFQAAAATLQTGNKTSSSDTEKTIVTRIVIGPRAIPSMDII